MELFKKGYNMALKYLSYKSSTELEISQYLLRKDIDTETIISIINRLKEINYLNDIEYTKRYIIQNKEKLKSKKQTIRELEAKGIDREITIKFMAELYTEQMELEIAELIINKICRSSEPLSYSQLRNKINYKLRYKEFSNDTIKQSIALLKESDIINKKLEDSEEKLKIKAEAEAIKYLNKYSKKYDNKSMVKRNVLGALLRKGYPNEMCFEITNDLMRQ